MVIGALYFWGHFSLLMSNFWPQAPFDQTLTHFGIALVGVLWAYEGWHVVSYTAGEFKNAQRDLPRGLLYGTLIVAAAYLLANIGYYCVLSAQQVAMSERVAATAVTSILGGTAGTLVSVLILVAILGSLNGMIMTGPRVYYAMAQEGLFFRTFGKLSVRSRVPVFALLIQGMWSACLTLLGTFQELFTYVIFTAWIFYGLSVAGVIILRIRRPEIDRPFRCPGYPWLPALFALSALGVTLSAVISSPLHALIGIGLVLTGLPVFMLFFARQTSPTQ
jgi:basic amino acid/polyamine antiporter, APA family